MSEAKPQGYEYHDTTAGHTQGYLWVPVFRELDALVWPTNEIAAALRVSSSAVVHASPKGAALLAAAGRTPEEMLRGSGVGGL